MQIWEFVRELAFFFPLSGTDEHKNKIFDSYVENLEGICLTNKSEYDWKKVLQTIQRTYTYSKFPPLADIIKCLPECKIIKPYTEQKDDGQLGIVTLPNGYKYSFITRGNGKPINELKDDLKFKYKTFNIEIFPKGSVLIGKEVILP